MDKRKVAKLNMYLAVQQTLQANQGAINALPRLSNEVINFNGLITQINQLNSSLSTGTNGITNGVSQLETDMVEKVTKLARTALVWAKDTRNNSLMALFDVVKSDFIRVPDTECYAKANAILTQIEANQRELATAVNIAENVVVDARELVTNYQTSLGTTQSAIKNNKSLGEETDALFVKADASLNTITDLVVNALDEPAFANALMATKVINDAAVRKTGVTIAVTGKETNEPITTAWAYVEGTDKKDDADQDGLCELYKLRPGTYTIRIEAEGYQTEKLTATVEQGKITELETSLNKA